MPLVALWAREVYGRLLYYPVNQAARDLARLSGAKTFTSQQVGILKDLGFPLDVRTSAEIDGG